MASPREIELIAELRDTAYRLLTSAGTTSAQDPAAWNAVNEATTYLINPGSDAEGRLPVFGYVATVAGTPTHFMVDTQRGVWRFDIPTKKYVLAFP